MSQTTRFRARRIELGLTQQEIADECTRLGVFVTDSQISKIERNVSTPLPGLRWALKQVLGDDPVTLQQQQMDVAS